MSYFVFCCYLFICKLYIADQLSLLEKRELICLLSFTLNYVVSVRKGFLFLLVLGMGCVILMWHSQGLQYNNFEWPSPDAIREQCLIFFYKIHSGTVCLDKISRSI